MMTVDDVKAWALDEEGVGHAVRMTFSVWNQCVCGLLVAATRQLEMPDNICPACRILLVTEELLDGRVGIAEGGEK
jgi:hypothetical protein